MGGHIVSWFFYNRFSFPAQVVFVGGFDPTRPYRQAVAMGVVPSLPPVDTFIVIAHRVELSRCPSVFIDFTPHALALFAVAFDFDAR